MATDSESSKDPGTKDQETERRGVRASFAFVFLGRIFFLLSAKVMEAFPHNDGYRVRGWFWLLHLRKADIRWYVIFFS